MPLQPEIRNWMSGMHRPVSVPNSVGDHRLHIAYCDLLPDKVKCLSERALVMVLTSLFSITVVLIAIDFRLYLSL